MLVDCELSVTGDWSWRGAVEVEGFQGVVDGGLLLGSSANIIIVIVLCEECGSKYNLEIENRHWEISEWK